MLSKDQCFYLFYMCVQQSVDYFVVVVLLVFFLVFFFRCFFLGGGCIYWYILCVALRCELQYIHHKQISWLVTLKHKLHH